MSNQDQKFVARLQYEIVYTHILDFKDIYRRLVAPYLKLAARFTINRERTVEESIRLEMPNENAIIEVRWDRLIIIMQGETKEVNKDTLAVQTFHTIFKKLDQEDKLIGDIRFILELKIIEPKDKSFEALVNDYTKKYLTDKVSNKIKPDDLAISFEKDEGTRHFSIHVGPYMQNDINRHGLLPVKEDQRNAKYSDTNGYLTIITTRDKLSEYTGKQFRELIKESFQKLPNYEL